MANYRFRKVHEGDSALLYAWFCQDHIKPWWPQSQDWLTFKRDFQDKYHSTDRQAYVSAYVAVCDDTPVGYIQVYDATRIPDFNGHDPVTILGPALEGIWGIDFIIGDAAYIGKGHGELMLKQFVVDVIYPLNPVAVITDPSVDNMRAISVLKKLGFVAFQQISSRLGTLQLMILPQEALLGLVKDLH